MGSFQQIPHPTNQHACRNRTRQHHQLQTRMNTRHTPESLFDGPSEGYSNSQQPQVKTDQVWYERYPNPRNSGTPGTSLCIQGAKTKGKATSHRPPQEGPVPGFRVATYIGRGMQKLLQPSSIPVLPGRHCLCQQGCLLEEREGVHLIWLVTLEICLLAVCMRAPDLRKNKHYVRKFLS